MINKIKKNTLFKKNKPFAIILLYLKHVVFDRILTRINNEGVSYSEAICRATCLVNLSSMSHMTMKDYLTLSDQDILRKGKAATLLQIAKMMNVPRESIRRKSEYLFTKKYLQHKGKHQVFITKKWIHKSCANLEQITHSLIDTAKQIQKLR